MVFTSYLLGILRIQANAKHVLNHPGDLSFISARPAHPGSSCFFLEGEYSKKVLRKGREGRPSFESQEVKTSSLLSPFILSTASPRFAKE
jgi:hypothetical protein